MNENLEQIIRPVLWIIVLALLSQMGLCYNLWISVNRTYPFVGLVDGFFWGLPWRGLLLLVFELALCSLCFSLKYRNRSFLAAFVLTIEDTTRLQIWFY